MVVVWRQGASSSTRTRTPQSIITYLTNCNAWAKKSVLTSVGPNYELDSRSVWVGSDSNMNIWEKAGWMCTIAMSSPPKATKNHKNYLCGCGCLGVCCFVLDSYLELGVTECWIRLRTNSWSSLWTICSPWRTRMASTRDIAAASYFQSFFHTELFIFRILKKLVRKHNSIDSSVERVSGQWMAGSAFFCLWRNSYNSNEEGGKASIGFFVVFRTR